MNIEVRRNAYGSQPDNFTAHIRVPQVSPDEFPVVFVRAPGVEKYG